MTAELTSADYAFLIILKAEGREISNSEMDELYAVRLVKPDLERLNSFGYVATDTRSRPFRHTLTRSGSRAVARPLEIGQHQVPEGGKRAAGERQLFWAAMVAQHKLLTQQGIDRAEPIEAPAVEPLDLDGRIRAAYAELAELPGSWVALTALRPLLADASKAEVDKALEQMLDAPDVRLEPEAMEHRVDASATRAAVHIGGEDRHKLAIGRP